MISMKTDRSGVREACALSLAAAAWGDDDNVHGAARGRAVLESYGCIVSKNAT